MTHLKLFSLLYHFSECTIQSTCAWCRLSQNKDGAAEEEEQEACHQLSICQAALRAKNPSSVTTTVVITIVVILLLVIAICVMLYILKRKHPQLLTTCWAGLRSLCCRYCKAKPKDEPAERQVPAREDDITFVLQGETGNAYSPDNGHMSLRPPAQLPVQVQETRKQEQDNRGFIWDSDIYDNISAEHDARGQQSPLSPPRSPQGQP